MICLCNNYLLIITLTNLLITDSAPACETIQVSAFNPVYYHDLTRYYLESYAMFCSARLCVTSVLLCVTPWLILLKISTCVRTNFHVNWTIFECCGNPNTLDLSSAFFLQPPPLTFLAVKLH